MKKNAKQSPHQAEAVRVLKSEAQAVLNIIQELDATFDRAVELIAGAKGSLVVSGLGKSGLIGTKISATFSSTGTPSHFLHPTEAMHGDIGRIRRDDVLLLLSSGGQTEEVLALAALVKQDRVPIVSMTGKRESHLSRISDVHLCIGDVTEACSHNLAPTASTTALLALGDALALAVSNAKHFTAEDFKKSHPGGLLGKQMLPLTQIMRMLAGKNLPLIAETLTVQEVLNRTAAGGRRAGAVIIIDAKGKLAGIFTDADLAKLLVREGPKALQYPIKNVMTANPRRLSDTARVREAVQLVREFRIDEIPIVDQKDRPLGLVDVQDLVALKVIEE